jgi:hypothetical protein
MVAWFTGLNPVLQALVATLFTWAVTALGAASSSEKYWTACSVLRQG